MPKRLTEAQVNDILMEYQSGTPVASIAERFGINKCYPGMIAKSRGLARRTRRGARHYNKAVIKTKKPAYGTLLQSRLYKPNFELG